MMKRVDLERGKTRMVETSLNRFKTQFEADLVLENGTNFTRLPKLFKEALVWAKFNELALMN